MNKYAFLLLLPVWFCFSACQPDEMAPVITIASPLEGQSFQIGESVTLLGLIVDDRDLSTASFVVQDSTGLPSPEFNWYSTSLIEKGREVEFNESWDLSTDIPTGSYTLQFDATDQAGNKTSFRLNIFVKP